MLSPRERISLINTLNDSGVPVYNLNTSSGSSLGFDAEMPLEFSSDVFAGTATLDLFDVDGDNDLDFIVNDPVAGGQTVVFEQLQDASRSNYFAEFSSDFLAPLSPDSSTILFADLAADADLAVERHAALDL
mgnify:CR=1 FL=1